MGVGILNEMVGQPVLKHSFKRKAKVGDDKVQIDPLLLFQRLIISGSQANDLTNTLTYELCNYPPALFEAKDIHVEAVKSQLAAVIWSEVPLEPPPSQNFKYVLDRGALLHRIPWQLGDTYGKILQDYGNYGTKHYGKAVVVYDGYEAGPSTKDDTHQCRTGCEGRKVTFNLSMKLQLKRMTFSLTKRTCNGSLVFWENILPCVVVTLMYLLCKRQ